MTTIWKDFYFDAAHQLPGVPADHQCARLHGHTYRLRVFVTGDVDEKTGMILDYAYLKKMVGPVIDHLDHHYLNEIIPNPTTEIVAKWIFVRVKASMPQLCKVVLKESETTGCEYEE